MQNTPFPDPSTLFSVLLNSDLLRWLLTEFIQLWRESRFTGLYKVEDHQITLELFDKDGHDALYTKRQKVQFLQNGIFAILDQAWGDGDIFADYKCSPGLAVDRYREGFRWKILLSLRGTKNKGDKEEFFIERKIREGFATSDGYWQTIIDHPTESLTLRVTFPPDRYPKRVEVIEENLKRTHSLHDGHRTLLNGARVQYAWSSQNPRLYEGYILQWEW